MAIIFNKKTKTFHLYNGDISYLMTILPNGHLGDLCFEGRIHHKEDFSYLMELSYRPMTAYVFDGYPISSIGSHVSVAPNHQVFRETPLHTRANVAYFGTFGYGSDLNRLTDQEQILFMKKYRRLLHFGRCYRLSSPSDGNVTAWICVSEDKRETFLGWYRVLLHGVNLLYTRLYLDGLDTGLPYRIWVDIKERDGLYYGDRSMRTGLVSSDRACGQVPLDERPGCDHDPKIYMLRAEGQP